MDRAPARSQGNGVPHPPPSARNSVAGLQASPSPRPAQTSRPGGGQASGPRVASVDSRVRRYVADADAQLADNPIAAANALRIALSLTPDDEVLKLKLAEAERRSDERLAGEHLASARAHERNHNWKAAGKYYAKAARGRQSGELYVQAAQCFRKDSDGLRVAGEQARKAIELDPTHIDAYLLLAEIYAEAGMVQSAIKVLRTAASLEPARDAIQKRLAQLERGER